MTTATSGIGSVSSGTSTVSSASATGSSALGKDEFLKLLMAQLGNQDPTSPTDNQQFVAQLAQFAQVEAAQTTNSDLDSLLLAQAAANQTAVTGMVGKDVRYHADSVHLGKDGTAQLGGDLAAKAADVTAVITDSSGKVVRTLHLGGQDTGSLTATWDGRDDHGQPLPAGDYKVALTASDAQGKSVGVTQTASGEVTGVSFADGGAELVVNGVKLKLSDIVEIDQPDTSGTATSS